MHLFAATLLVDINRTKFITPYIAWERIRQRLFPHGLTLRSVHFRSDVEDTIVVPFLPRDPIEIRADQSMSGTVNPLPVDVEKEFLHFSFKRDGEYGMYIVNAQIIDKSTNESVQINELTGKGKLPSLIKHYDKQEKLLSSKSKLHKNSIGGKSFLEIAHSKMRGNLEADRSNLAHKNLVRARLLMRRKGN